jgi:hypothetical protein
MTASMTKGSLPECSYIYINFTIYISLENVDNFFEWPNTTTMYQTSHTRFVDTCLSLIKHSDTSEYLKALLGERW